MKYRLICFDIDGTLLDDNKKIMPQVRRAVVDAADRGIQIVLASGRMPAGVESIERELGVQCVKMCCAGTYVILGNQCICTERFMPDTMRIVYKEFAEQNHLNLWIFQEKKWLVTGIDPYIEREIEIIQYEPQIVNVDELADKWEKENTGPSKLLIAADPEKIKQIYAQMKKRALPEIDIACSADTFIEIFPKGVSKGTAFIKICEALHIDPQYAVAVGDQELDIPMIEAAGTGIAMGNAIDELKQRADFVTKTNNEAGVAYALEHFLKVFDSHESQ